jgi:hypothetical protein
MSKIQTIKLQNFKAIDSIEAEFKGCTAIVTGGNNKGKTSFLKGIVDRIRFIRPDVMVKKGEKEGRGELVLDSGEKFVWEFDAGRDKLTYITNEARKSVTKEFGATFFPPVFDIDKFLQSSPKEQVKQLQAIVGLDFTDIDLRYKKAYDARTERNREAEIYHVKLEKMLKVDRVESVDLTELKAKKEAEKERLNSIYIKNKKANEQTRLDYQSEKDKVHALVEQHAKCLSSLEILKKAGYITGDAFEFVDHLKKSIPEIKEPSYIEEMPDRTELDKIDAALLTASETNTAAQKYQEYTTHVNETKAAKNAADEADLIVKSIESERQKMIESASFPEGISITSEGILVDGLPLDKNQISTSKLYCSALRIASMNLGEVKTLYFDASFLDKNTLSEIQDWANENDLQLLIERPDFDGGEIQYQLIEA